MPVTPEFTGHPSATADGDEQRECPRCHRTAQRNGRRRNGHCATCGLPLVRSVRKSEVDAWRQLYGGPPARLVRKVDLQG